VAEKIAYLFNGLMGDNVFNENLSSFETDLSVLPRLCLNSGFVE
jgi:hypothetical protein